jgi:hypothetical protein
VLLGAYARWLSETGMAVYDHPAADNNFIDVFILKTLALMVQRTAKCHHENCSS